LFAPFAGPLAARLNPFHATWLLTGAAVALAACSTLALGLLAASAAVRIPLVANPQRTDPGAVPGRIQLKAA
jgi:hypothetical protein